MNQQACRMIKEDMEKNLLEGWESLYGIIMSKNGMIWKKEWEKYWRDKLQQTELK